MKLRRRGDTYPKRRATEHPARTGDLAKPCKNILSQSLTLRGRLPPLRAHLRKPVFRHQRSGATRQANLALRARVRSLIRITQPHVLSRPARLAGDFGHGFWARKARRSAA